LGFWRKATSSRLSHHGEGRRRGRVEERFQNVVEALAIIEALPVE